MGEAVLGLESAGDVFSLFAPDLALAVRAADQILLLIHDAEEHVASQASERDQSCAQRRQFDGVACEVLCLYAVYCGEPSRRAPGQVEAKMIVADVDGAKVPGSSQPGGSLFAPDIALPVLVDEEIYNIDCMQDAGNDDGVRDEAM